jgi:hypothetical protein
LPQYIAERGTRGLWQPFETADPVWSDQRRKGEQTFRQGTPDVGHEIQFPIHGVEMGVRSKNWSVSQKHPQKAVSILPTF